MIRSRALLGLCAILLATAGAAAQGLYIESKSTRSEAVERLWHAPHMFRTHQDDGKISIVRIDKGMYYLLDPAKQTYVELTFAELKSMKGIPSRGTEIQREAPPPHHLKKDALALTESKPGKSLAAKEDLEKTTETKVILGFPCVKYLRTGRQAETLWVTTEVAAFESARGDMELLVSSISSRFVKDEFGGLWQKDIPGLPTVVESEGNVQTVTRIAQQSINPSEFEVPAKYNRTKFSPPEGSKE